MAIENIGDFVRELETYEEWSPISIGRKNDKTCLFIHDSDGRTIVGCISLPDHSRLAT